MSILSLSHSVTSWSIMYVRTDANTFSVAFPEEADYHDHCPGRWRVDVWLEVLKELWSADKWVESSC